MSDFDTVIIGTLGRDPELRFTPTGQAVATLNVASSNRYKRGDDWVEETTWVDVTAWASLGENCAASLVKGNRVIIKGRVRQEEWEDRETGAKRTKLSCVAEEVGAALRWATAEVVRNERSKADG